MQTEVKLLTVKEELNDFLLYTAPDGDVKIEVFFAEESIWLTQKRMAMLFNVDVRTINEHLKNIFESAELQENSVIRKFRTTASDGKSYETNIYNLDAIISIGYRVNSSQATQFRIWATARLKQYLIKGFTMSEFAESVNKFLEFNEYRVLGSKGKISMQQALIKAEKEYLQFNKTQKIENDFEKQVIKKLQRKQN